MPTHSELITSHLSISVNTVEEAPKYQQDWRMVRIEKAIVVKNGTVGGKTTVDLQLVDGEGNKYLVMAHGSILSALASVIAGVES